MNNKVYSIDEIKKRFEEVARRYEIDEAYLFGSYARGEATRMSDLDFYVGKGKTRGLELYGFYHDVKNAMNKGVNFVTTSTELDEEFEREIRKDLVKIYG